MTTLQNGRYILRGELGDDACGIVYLAQDTKIAQRDVAIRKIADNALEPKLLQRIAQLNQPNLPSVYDVFEEAGFRYIVIEYPRGQNLADIALGRPLKESVVLAWAKQIAAGLSYLHSQGLAHGDIRPAHVVLQDGKQIKIINGIPSGCGLVAASRYTAPEILSISGTPPSIAGDIYSFGATLHHVLTGIDPNTQPLMSFAPPDVRRPDLSSGTTAAIVKALNAEPSQRFASISDMMTVMTAVSATQSSQSSGDIPAIGFTPSYPVTPADGPTQRYTPSADQPIPIPPQSSYQTQPNYDAYQQTGQQYNQSVPPPLLPDKPQTDSGRWGYIALGVLLLLLLLGGGWWLLNRNANSANPRTTVVSGLPTTTRDEGRLVTDAERTATALALVPTQPNATQIPTLDAPRATADAIETFTAATAAAFDNDIEAIYQRALGYENTGQLGLALSDYDEVLRRRPDYKDAQQRRDRIQDLLNATSVAGGIQATSQAATSQANANATATAGAVPPPTLTPTATPIGQVVGDVFDGSSLDPKRWASLTNNGTITLANGEMQLSSRNNQCFPVVQTLTNTLNLQGNFDLTVIFRYSEVTTLGSGFMFADAMPTPCGDKDRAGTAWGGIWQDSQQGLIVEFHRDAASNSELKDIRLQYTQGQPSYAEHTLTMQRRNNRDTYILDGNVLFEEQAGATPTVLWFGNPAKSPVPGDWTVINILNVDVRQQP